MFCKYISIIYFMIGTVVQVFYFFSIAFAFNFYNKQLKFCIPKFVSAAAIVKIKKSRTEVSRYPNSSIICFYIV